MAHPDISFMEISVIFFCLAAIVLFLVLLTKMRLENQRTAHRE